jgi:hypothetical protein
MPAADLMGLAVIESGEDEAIPVGEVIDPTPGG